MSAYKAGDVAMVTAYNRREPYRAFFDGKTWREYGADIFCVDSPTSLRPLVVLDLPNGALAGWPVLVRCLQEASEATGLDMVFNGLIEQIETQVRSKPVEPTGLGAVVEDAEGDRWVRCRRAGHQGLLGVEWENERTCAHLPWHAIDAVRELSAGWSA